MIKLKDLLYEVETFTATNKKSGETAVFKTKDARDAAVKAGTHDDIDSSDDKSKGKKNSMFSKGNYDAPDVKKDKEETPKKSKPKKESPKGPNPLHQHKKKYLPKEISNFTETLKDKNGNPIKGFDVNNLKVGASLPDNFEELIEKENPNDYDMRGKISKIEKIGENGGYYIFGAPDPDADRPNTEEVFSLLPDGTITLGYNQKIFDRAPGSDRREKEEWMRKTFDPDSWDFPTKLTKSEKKDILDKVLSVNIERSRESDDETREIMRNIEKQYEGWLSFETINSIYEYFEEERRLQYQEKENSKLPDSWVIKKPQGYYDEERKKRKLRFQNHIAKGEPAFESYISRPVKNSMKLKDLLSEKLINEGTRSQIGVIDRSGNIVSTYVHWDGYPDWVGKIAKNHYGGGKIKQLLKVDKGIGISSLNKKMDGGGDHTFQNPGKDQTIFYGRDRGEKGGKFTKGKFDKVSDYIKNAGNQSGAEYVYLYNEKDKKWYFADTYKDKELKLL